MSTSPSIQSGKTEDSKQRLLIIAAAIIAILLAVNAVLLYSYTRKANANDQLATELDETEQVKTQLEKQYYEALAELEEMRGSNEELNALIDQQKEELRAQKERIDAMLRDRGNLDRARNEIRQMNLRVEQYVGEINQLREQNQILTGENATLVQQRDSLTQNLEKERGVSNQLSAERQQLSYERDQLSGAKAELERKVNLASVVKVTNVEVSGQRIRRSGKAVTRREADNIEQLEICFAALPNDVAQPGDEKFVIRLINPQGETLALDQLGSGVFTNQATGSQMRYTISKVVDYNQKSTTACVMWAPGQTFQPGNYEVEVYNKGHLAGSGSFRLN